MYLLKIDGIFLLHRCRLRF